MTNDVLDEILGRGGGGGGTNAPTRDGPGGRRERLYVPDQDEPIIAGGGGGNNDLGEPDQYGNRWDRKRKVWVSPDGNIFDPDFGHWINPKTGQINVDGDWVNEDDSRIAGQQTSTSRQKTQDYQNQVLNLQTTTQQDVNRQEVENVTKQGTTNLTSNMMTTGQTNITGTERKYIDIPTPEEFLDDFQTGLATYMKGLTGGAGAKVSRNASMWIMENMDLFLGDYLGELGEMAKRGEQVFKVTPIRDDAKFLGQRQGDVRQTQTTGQKTTTGTETEQGQTQTNRQGTTQQTTQETRRQQQQQQRDGGPMQTQTTQDQDLTTRREQEQSQQNLQENYLRNINKTEQFNLGENVNMREDIYGRSKIGVIHALSPMDYLAKAWSPESMNLRYEGFRGARAARARVGQGTIGARRVS